MKPFALWRHSEKDTMRWHGRPPQGEARYRVAMWIGRGDIRLDREIAPREPVRLSDLLTRLLQHEIDDMLAALPQPEDMGFEVFLWR